MAAPKIIVLGSLNGQLEAAFSKLATLHKKNNFSFALITGNLFTDETDDAAESLVAGKIEVPLPTYFTVGTNPLPTAVADKVERDEEICHNLHFLGKRSTTKTSGGVRIVVLGGQLDTNIVGGVSKEQYLPFHTADDVKALKGSHSADILLTAIWPQGVWKGSKIGLGVEPHSIPSTEGIAELCATLKPRYHFAPSPGNFFWEREAFVHPTSEGDDVTTPSISRFISMAPYGNKEKAKAMYAFTLPAPGAAPADVPAGLTASPFAAHSVAKKRPRDDGYQRFADHDASHHSRHHHKKRRRDRSPPPGPDRCFFCLSNPNLPTHMVCSIGNDSYLAVAKGPLPTATTFAAQGLDFPGHVLIVPLPHEPTIAAMNAADDPSAAARVYAEMARFRDALQAAVARRSAHALGAVTWEISRARNVHLHWQFLPVPARLLRDKSVAGGLVEAGFRIEAENLKYPPLAARELPPPPPAGVAAEASDPQAEPGDYLRVWVWADDGEEQITGTSLVMKLDPEAHFDVQFPRKVMAKLLDLEKRVVWQDVAQTEEEEMEDVSKLREAFKEFDFTLREGE